MIRVAEIINEVINNFEDEKKLDELLEDVKELCSGFPLYQELALTES